MEDLRIKIFREWCLENMNDPDIIGMPNSREEKAAFFMWIAWMNKIENISDNDLLEKEFVNDGKWHLRLRNVDEAVMAIKISMKHMISTVKSTLLKTNLKSHSIRLLIDGRHVIPSIQNLDYWIKDYPFDLSETSEYNLLSKHE